MTNNSDHNDITVYKLDHEGREVWNYRGKMLSRGTTWIEIEARFNRDDKDAGYVIFRRNDRFLEWFYSDRWYNIFEIHDVTSDALKGWYCNISRPAMISGHEIRSDDLALDLWITPTGNIQLLDEDEFAALPLDPDTRKAALSAMRDLVRRVEKREAPFEALLPFVSPDSFQNRD
ncbi:MAG: DUF402 domain-containing protein [Chloroflexota bacterium]